MAQTDRPPARDFSGQGDGGKRFGSSHPTGFNGVFADGSVHSVSYTIDPVVFGYLGNKRDGKTISGDAF
jgi:prepilin-type processing-associated H-X9-DG protein